MNSQKTIRATNAGELDSLLLGRDDLQKFSMGCDTLENARVMRVGGSHRRAGLKYGAPLVEQDKQSRLKGFNFSSGQGFVLEFSDHLLRIYRGGELVQGGGSVLEYATPWSESQIPALDFAQRIDLIVVTHGDVETQLITRVADDEWEVGEFPWKERVWELYTTDTVSLTPGAITGDTTITSDTPIFATDWVGTRLKLVHVRDETPVSGVTRDVTVPTTKLTMSSAVTTLGQRTRFQPDVPTSYWTAIQDYDGPGGDYVAGNDHPEDYPEFFSKGIPCIEPQEVRGPWTFETFDEWTGTYVIERSYNGGVSWSVVKTLTAEDDNNYLVEDEEDQDAGASFRVLITDFTFDTGEKFTFTAASVDISGVALITEYVSPVLVNVTVERDFEEVAATTEWYEDAFNPRNGYPKAATFHQKRLCLGGSLARKQFVWLSRTKSIYDFTIGTLATDGMSFELDANEYEEVIWMVSHQSLLVGTTSTEWAISSPEGASITPESNRLSLQTSHGSVPGISAVPLQNNVLFLQKGQRKVMELSGGSSRFETYVSTDLTQLASHITRGGVTQISRGEVPDSTLFVVTGGELAVLTYERSQNVVGWSRWKTVGDIESFGTCNGANEEEDIYLIVNRGDRRDVLYLAPDMLRVEEDAKEDSSRMSDLRFLDFYVEKKDPVGFTVFDGLETHEGETVEVFADGEPAGSYVVTGGQVVLVESAYNAIAGFGYRTNVTPMPLNAGNIGAKVTTYEVELRVRNTIGAQVKQGDRALNSTGWNEPRIVSGDTLPIQTGDFRFTPTGEWKRLSKISIIQDQPYPMTVLAVRANFKTSR